MRMVNACPHVLVRIYSVPISVQHPLQTPHAKNSDLANYQPILMASLKFTTLPQLSHFPLTHTYSTFGHSTLCTVNISRVSCKSRFGLEERFTICTAGATIPHLYFVDPAIICNNGVLMFSCCHENATLWYYFYHALRIFTPNIICPILIICLTMPWLIQKSTSSMFKCYGVTTSTATSSFLYVFNLIIACTLLHSKNV